MYLSATGALNVLQLVTRPVTSPARAGEHLSDYDFQGDHYGCRCY